jgi:hypothetical protein
MDPPQAVNRRLPRVALVAVHVPPLPGRHQKLKSDRLPARSTAGIPMRRQADGRLKALPDLLPSETGINLLESLRQTLQRRRYPRLIVSPDLGESLVPRSLRRARVIEKTGLSGVRPHAAHRGGRC